MSGYKIVNLNEDMKMAKEWEHVVARAYSLDESRTTIQVPKREHLEAQHVPGVSCKHAWSPIYPDLSSAKQGNWGDYLRQLFGEVDLGEKQLMCTRCSSFALADKDGKIWAYDASATLLPEQPKKEKSGVRDSNKRGRK